MTVACDEPHAKQREQAERPQFPKRVQAALAARGMPASATELQRVFNTRNFQFAVAEGAASEYLPAMRKLYPLAF
jgi:hypothetical protein